MDLAVPNTILRADQKERMITEFLIRKNEYHDSVFLMRVAKRLSDQKGILQAAALMGTEKNKALLAEIGFGGAEVTTATPNDLILAIQADDRQSLRSILENIDEWLQPILDSNATPVVRTLEEAVARQPRANLVVISVPGTYAAREARKALEHGLNVFLFSDNVPVESELSLKEFARQQGLIVMGPDCGTAIIGGIGIGFANTVRRGPVGVIGASGTGIQEFTTLVHHAGSGISQAIGIGGRDLSDQIGGVSLLIAMEALESDPQTEVIAILSKPPGPKTVSKLIQKIHHCHKPVITCFLGIKEGFEEDSISHWRARTLDDAAALAVELTTGHKTPSLNVKSPDLEALLSKMRMGMTLGQKYIRGIFAGGTFCYQAQQILKDAGITVYSNVPIEGNLILFDPFRSVEHSLVDLGSDEFTAGRPHPMIDSRLRCERIIAEAQDPQVGILLFDLILGFNVPPDPAGELASAIKAAKNVARYRGGDLTVIASVCGTEEDSQDLRGQIKQLEEEGVFVFRSSSQAAFFCAQLAVSLEEASRGE
jgi:succinyl-CoA synthetase alpha subunit